jgi:hypothetical protein
VSLDQLDEHAAAGRRMQEGDLVAAGSGPRHLVDELDAFGAESVEVRLEILRAVRDVVEGLAPSVQKAPDGGVGTEGLEQLDGPHERNANALCLEGLGLGTAFARQEFEETATLFDGVDGDRHVIDGAARRRDVSHRRMLHSALYGDKEKWNANE